jgi:hypothetical protein
VDDVEAIKQLKARYFRLMDTKDWTGFREVFTEDVVVDVSADGAGVHEGVDVFLAMLVPILTDVITVHHGHTPEITITSETTATGTWAMEDVLRFPPGGPIADLHGWGHYHDTSRQGDDGWRIASTRLTRLRLDVS